MIKNVLTHLGGIGLYGVISICLFFAVFTAAVARALFVKRPLALRMSALPLDSDYPDSTSNPPSFGPGEKSHE